MHPRVWLNGDFYNGFSTDIKNHMQTMAVAWNGTTLNDKVKLLSVTELGYSHTYALIEGNRYYEYGPHIKNLVSYWLRTYSTGNSSYVWNAADNGHVNYNGYTYTYGLCLAPVIRLG